MRPDLKQFLGLLIFGNIENLILAAQGVSAGVNPIILGFLSIVAVISWLEVEIGRASCRERV